MSAQIEVRAFAAEDAVQVRELFIKVNRLLAPPELKEAFEEYIALSLREEIDRIAHYYTERDGGFWVAMDASRVVGTFGLEPSSATAMELRRMYVAPDARRRGIARTMLRHAEEECRRRNRSNLELSTSELQGEALSLYRGAGYQMIREEVAQSVSNKTLGGGIRRYYFAKRL
jgi:GNAT superfamily N-acetyltransferase